MTDAQRISVSGSGGPVTVRVAPAPGDPGVMENVALWADGCWAAERYHAGRVPPVSDEGHTVRIDGATTYFDFDPSRLPAGPRLLKASMQVVDKQANPEPPHLVRREAGTVTVHCTQPPPVLTAVAAKPAFFRAPSQAVAPCFRDPQTNHPVFVRGMFGATAEELIARPTLAASLKAAGVNCLFTGAGAHVARNLGRPVTDAEFAAGQVHRGPIQAALTADPSWLILGDGMDWTFTEDSLIRMDGVSETALAAWVAELAATGRFLGLDLCDETGFRLPETQGLRLERLANACRRGGLPVAWTTTPLTWIGTPARWYESHVYSDYLSLGREAWHRLFYHPKESSGPGSGWEVASADQYLDAMDQLARNKWLRHDCPRLQNVSICGGPSVPPHNTLAEIGAAICGGAVGVKVYHLDTLHWKQTRQVHPWYQIGADPDTNPDRWAAMSHAFAAIVEHEARILQWAAPVQHTLGRWWLTRETSGPAGRFWLGVNRLEGPQSAPPVPAWATRVEAVTPTGRVSNPTTIPAGSWLIATD